MLRFRSKIVTGETYSATDVYGSVKKNVYGSVSKMFTGETYSATDVYGSVRIKVLRIRKKKNVTDPYQTVHADGD